MALSASLSGRGQGWVERTARKECGLDSLRRSAVATTSPAQAAGLTQTPPESPNGPLIDEIWPLPAADRTNACGVCANASGVRRNCAMVCENACSGRTNGEIVRADGCRVRADVRTVPA